MVGKMKKETIITQERDQFRTTIPKKLMEESNKKKGDVAEWVLKKGKLTANIISHKEFMKKVKEANKLESKTKDALEVEDERPIR